MDTPTQVVTMGETPSTEEKGTSLRKMFFIFLLVALIATIVTAFYYNGKSIASQRGTTIQ